MCIVWFKCPSNQFIFCSCLYPGIGKLIMMHRIMYIRLAFRNSSVFRNSQIDCPVKFRVLSYAPTNWAVVEFYRSVLFLLVVGL